MIHPVLAIGQLMAEWPRPSPHASGSRSKFPSPPVSTLREPISAQSSASPPIAYCHVEPLTLSRVPAFRLSVSNATFLPSPCASLAWAQFLILPSSPAPFLGSAGEFAPCRWQIPENGNPPRPWRRRTWACLGAGLLRRRHLVRLHNPRRPTGNRVSFPWDFLLLIILLNFLSNSS